MIVLGLGGNVGDDAAILARFGAVARAFEAWGEVRRSSVYRTAPIGGPAQADFLNAAIRVRTADDPHPEELAAMLAQTERLLGRDRAREVANGPRAIDVDLLLWGDRTARYQAPALWGGWLEVPHPRLAGRAFALRPLADVVGGEAPIPGSGLTVDEALRRAGDQGVRATDLSF